MAGSANPIAMILENNNMTEAKASIRVTDSQDFRIAVKDGSASTIDALAVDSV